MKKISKWPLVALLDSKKCNHYSEKMFLWSWGTQIQCQLLSLLKCIWTSRAVPGLIVVSFVGRELTILDHRKTIDFLESIWIFMPSCTWYITLEFIIIVSIGISVSKTLIYSSDSETWYKQTTNVQNNYDNDT